MSGVNVTSCEEDNLYSEEDVDGIIDELMSDNWDPSARNKTADPRPHSSLFLSRVKKDLLAVQKDAPPGIFVVPDDEDLTLVHAVVVGVRDTPYEGGFFYFLIRFSSDYPIRPPLVRLMTTDAGNVRFNPNVYKNGKVCLSILGTWAGPSWMPSLRLTSLLVSIQSLLNERPYHNEPGFENLERCIGDSDKYNRLLRHETLRAAVCGMLENETALHMPDALHGFMRARFLADYTRYRDAAVRCLMLDGQRMVDPFNEMNGGTFDHARTLRRMERLYEKLASETPAKKNLNATAELPNEDVAECVAASVVESVIESVVESVAESVAVYEDAVKTEAKQTQTDATEVKNVGDSNSPNLDESKHTQTDANFTAVSSSHAVSQTDELCDAVNEISIDDDARDDGLIDTKNVDRGAIDGKEVDDNNVDDNNVGGKEVDGSKIDGGKSDEGKIEGGKMEKCKTDSMSACDDCKETQTEAYFLEVRQVRATESDEKQTQTDVAYGDVCQQINMAGKPIGIC